MLTDNQKNEKGTGQSKGFVPVANDNLDPFAQVHTPWPGWLWRKMDKLSFRARATVLISFCLFAAGLNTYVASNRIFGSDNASLSFGTIHPPQGLPRYDNGTRDLAKASRKEYHRMHPFKPYKGSQARAPTGKPIFDSIIAGRPWPMDSLAITENPYQLQNKSQILWNKKHIPQNSGSSENSF